MAAKSRIIVNAHRINQGVEPDLDAAPGGASDFYFVGRDEPEAARATVVELGRASASPLTTGDFAGSWGEGAGAAGQVVASAPKTRSSRAAQSRRRASLGLTMRSTTPSRAMSMSNEPAHAADRLLDTRSHRGPHAVRQLVLEIFLDPLIHVGGDLVDAHVLVVVALLVVDSRVRPELPRISCPPPAPVGAPPVMRPLHLIVVVTMSLALTGAAPARACEEAEMAAVEAREAEEEAREAEEEAREVAEEAEEAAAEAEEAAEEAGEAHGDRQAEAIEALIERVIEERLEAIEAELELYAEVGDDEGEADDEDDADDEDAFDFDLDLDLQIDVEL